ncbi:Hpt domain-containing protein [Nitrospira moscoviensis]|uniref:histidine kinase n=1 Tax=Nitrospira moscoviensis TaxID=42253 RepID=A0A0K2GCE0_NITMO|nr:Hpt domain-containing protein [Nitrospira moscoviensis]ALA58267.1 putative Chemotaxis protein CheA modulated with response regulator receiver region (Modular protein) [Nitrospira moscoviensis]
MESDFDRQNLVSIFVAEASDGMNVLTAALHPADGSVPQPQPLEEQYIVAHRIRGAAALYGYAGVARLAERLEALLEQASAIAEADWLRAVGAMREIVQGIQSQVESIGRGGPEDPAGVDRCLASSGGLLPPPDAESSTPAPASALTQDYLVPTLDADVLSYFVPEAEEYLDTIDGLVRTLDASPGDEDAIYRLFRTAHTLKGSSYTVGFHAIGDLAHPMEDCMAAVREGRARLSREVLHVMTQAGGLIRLLLRRDPAHAARLQAEIPPVLGWLKQLADGKAVALPGAAPVAVLRPDAPVPAAAAPAAEAEQPANLSDEYLVPHLDPEVLSYFAPEAQEYLETLEANLLRLDKDPQNKELINQLFRTAHTLKGSAYTVGFQSIGDLVHHLEDFMGAVRDGRLAVKAGHTDVLLRAVDVVRVLMRRDVSMAAVTRQRFAAAQSELKRLEQGDVVDQPIAEIGLAAPAAGEPAGEEQAQGRGAEGKSAEDREVIRVSRDRLERLLNLVGELVIGRGRLEQRLRVLEQLSQQVLACKARLVDAVQSFEEKHTFTFQQAAPAGPVEAAAQAFPGLSDFGSLELDKYDDFNILARRISEVTADISESMSQLSGSIRRSHDDMSQLQQLTLGMRDEIARARMVPIGTPFTRFRRAIREIARASGKEVSLVTSGEHTEVDTGVVERLVDPLIHLVRNAVYHGIEPAADRMAKGKPASGTVYLHAAHRGNSVIIEVEDDGAGLDLARIRAKAVKLGLVRPDQAQAMPDAEALKFIFAPGFSTAEKIGDQAGRGVGLDVVKRVIEGMNGHINVETLPGVGTKFTLDLPLTLLIATALLVRGGSERYAIPLPSVREVTMPTAASMQRMGEQTVLHLGEEAIEVYSLRHLLRREPGPVDIAMPIVIVRTVTGPVGVAVDELLGRQEIVIKSLGSLKPLERSVFGGATIDPEGRVVLVIDPGRLTARGEREAVAEAGTQEAPLLPDATLDPEEPSDDQAGAPILLIDDSLSIRKFVGRMLENAGYHVDTAVDGEDGLRKAAARSYRLIFTDLEMPKLNGFEVIQALRSRPQTQQTPVIVMTTRAGDKHRQMAISIGATSYVAKPVEERALLQEVERWVGRAPAVRK